MTLRSGEEAQAVVLALLECEREYDGLRQLRGVRRGLFGSILSWAGLSGLVSLVLGCAYVGDRPGDAAMMATAQPPGLMVSQTNTDTAKKEGCGSIPLPPTKFDHAPSIPMFIRHVNFGLVDRECRFHGLQVPTSLMSQGTGVSALLGQVTNGGFEAQACSWTYQGMGFVIMPAVGTGGVTAHWSECALRHEVGHINGWASTHPDAHFE